MDSLQQKIWSRPQLVILARGRAEESVLDNCKNSSIPKGASSKNNSCGKGPGQTCDRYCQTIGTT